MRTAIRRVVVAGAMVAALTAAAAPAANAAEPAGSEVGPTALLDCHNGHNTQGQYAWAYCGGGTGTYRAVAFCRNVVTGQKTTRYGPWRTPPTMSEVLCGSQEAVYGSALGL